MRNTTVNLGLPAIAVLKTWKLNMINNVMYTKAAILHKTLITVTQWYNKA